MQINGKTIKTYFIFFCLFAFVIFTYSYLYQKTDLIKNLLSTLYGYFIFVSVYSVQFIFQNRNKRNKLLTPGYVLYEVVYTTVLKMFILVFLLTFEIKLFELNCKITILTFITVVIFRLIAYFRIVDK